MTPPDPSFMGLQRHHIVISIVAILVVVALLLNYYLW
jgi:hypothetical protein